MVDAFTREDLEAIRHFAGEPCECDAGVRALHEAQYIKDEVDAMRCGPCKAKKWVEDGAKLAEELS